MAPSSDPSSPGQNNNNDGNSSSQTSFPSGASYTSPLSTRYASLAMRSTFSDENRFRLWRELWVALAEAEHALGLEVTIEQVEALREGISNFDLKKAAEYETKLRHDVMAHVHAFGDAVPVARPIIHLGATSCYVTDNSEVLQIRNGLDILIADTWRCVANLSSFAMEYKDVPTLGFTHFQAAQPTTVGKRAAMWLQDFLYDAMRLEEVRKGLRMRGVKGTTGTQASFLALFEGNGEKVRELEKRVAKTMGFDKCFSITGQTYTRKQDFTALSALAGLGQSAAKMACDIRLLQHMKEIEEPFSKNQIGSSAMAYKRNPMRCERICGLSRFLQTLLLNPAETASTQWLERTLDDSANRRLAISEAFLTADAILQLVMNVSSGLVVNERVIERNLHQELPFMASENVLMAAVRKGSDRQTLHEAIRIHSMDASKHVKEEGAYNDLIERIRGDELFRNVHDELDDICDARHFVGRAPQQVEEFVNEEVRPELESRSQFLVGEHAGDVRI